jgi:hypothetical protein
VRKWQREGRLMAGPPGQTAQWTPETGARLRPWQESQIGPRGGSNDGRVHDPGLPQEHAFSIPVLRKRTFQERLESMTKRLLHTPEDQQRRLLEEIATDFWKQGMPVTVDALTKAAATVLNGADNRIALSNRTAGGGK